LGLDIGKGLLVFHPSQKSEVFAMLKYVGNGSFIPGIPARDLSKDDVETFLKPQLKQVWKISLEEFVNGSDLYEFEDKKKLSVKKDGE
jgi:hypothetical protein